MTETVASPRALLAVPPQRLRRQLDPATLPFETTAEVIPTTCTIGQPRALDAIEFGLEVESFGYNLFLAGAPGSGRESTIRAQLARFAATRPAPADWIYVHNFADPDRPNAIRLPTGRGTRFALQLNELLQTILREIPRAFDSEDYERRRREALGTIAKRRDELYEQLRQFARDRGFSLETTPAGIMSVPVVNGTPLRGEDFERLPEAARQEIERRGAEIQNQVGASLRQLRQLDKEARAAVQHLDQTVAEFVTGPLFEDLREQYADQSEVLTYLEQVQKDVPERLDLFRTVGAPEMDVPASVAQFQEAQRREQLARYRANVLIDRDGLTGAPVVFERNPTYYNLIGRIDYRAAFGTMVTDFHQIKPGALHRANGGFLVLQVLDLLRGPFSWDALKRALQTREIQIENLGEQLSVVPTATLKPEPIPLDVKVILVGPASVYQALFQADEDFQELFKIEADFAPEMDWNDEHVLDYAAFISRRAERYGARPFHRSAVARVVEYGAWLREDQRKLSTRLLDIGDIVSEASFWAGKAGHEVVQAEDVDTAITKKRYRSSLTEERVREMVLNGTIMIDVSGARTGQVNGLSVMQFGKHAFGSVSRVTARVALGRGTVVSIEREIELSGPIHSKGVLILSGYLASQYSQHWPLALSASITFEQSYEAIDGDSASSTELYALLSALSDRPLNQGIAVTGSVNQYGEVQAIGGATRKIEGFYAICKARGLNGEQGVIVPATNVPNLMLDAEVVEAVRAGQFHIWAVTSIDEGIELLTGCPAGTRGEDGEYPAGSVHRRVEDRLHGYAERAQAFGQKNGHLTASSPAGASSPVRPPSVGGGALEHLS